MIDWTGKVDAKAAFALTIESAVLALAATLSRPLADLGGGRRAVFLAGGAVVAAAALFAMVAVFPRMSGRTARRFSAGDLVYFGHIRHWDPAELALTLRTVDPLPSLSRQLVAMSRVAWRKHRCVQASLCAAAVGAALLAVSVAVP
ncbi:Pycsar system effector family protein [Streptomyces sp. NBC_01264]|uniref:Pycsar system effector family protein n=1 Tax=Streptomyces sp. NBC_01264 TaxID=2903804 RepID=UPI00225309A5|nr:Pycsar system effector family protein [Streptomyces sp. NBC_01264]MCX4776509.1 DUF5706 domain-containing protein [Streptomyces sp. NBC_01264]